MARSSDCTDKAKSSQEMESAYNLRPRAKLIHSKWLEQEQAELESYEETIEQLDTAFMEE